MTEQELKFILSKGEGPFVEFKEKVGKTLVREMVAFANATGGQILLGVSDDSTPVGIRIDNRLKSTLQDMARNCDPSVMIELKTIGTILLIEVPEGINKPHACSDGFFIRIGANSQKLGRDEIFAMGITSGRLRFDEQICEEFNLESDLDEPKLEAYLDVAGLDKNLSVLDALINLDAARMENRTPVMTNAGVLLFAKNPQKFLKSALVVCAVYQGNEKVQILDRKIYNEGLLGNLEQVLIYVKRHIDTRFEISGLKRKEIPQYPDKALREAVVNAIMHRDYFDASGDVMVEIFKNKIIISNPGGLVSWLNPKDFGKYSRCRNNLLASLLMRTSYVEKMGTGIRRIHQELLDSGLPPAEFDYDAYNFSISISPQQEPEGHVSLNVSLNVPLNVPLNERVIGLVHENPGIQRKELAVFLDVTEKTVGRYLSDLISGNKIERRGSKKTGGYWIAETIGRKND